MAFSGRGKIYIALSLSRCPGAAVGASDSRDGAISGFRLEAHTIVDPAGTSGSVTIQSDQTRVIPIPGQASALAFADWGETTDFVYLGGAASQSARAPGDFDQVWAPAIYQMGPDSSVETVYLLMIEHHEPKTVVSVVDQLKIRHGATDFIFGTIISKTENHNQIVSIFKINLAADHTIDEE